MAKSLYEINLDYNRAINQARELESIAADLKKLAETEFEGCLSRVSVNWKGENASAYVKKGKTLQGKITKSAANLKATAMTIRNIAERTRKADLAARAIALASES